MADASGGSGRGTEDGGAVTVSEQAKASAEAFLAVDDEARLFLGDVPRSVASRWCVALDRWLGFYNDCRDVVDDVRGTPYQSYRHVAEQTARQMERA